MKHIVKLFILAFSVFRLVLNFDRIFFATGEVVNINTTVDTNELNYNAKIYSHRQYDNINHTKTLLKLSHNILGTCKIRIRKKSTPVDEKNDNIGNDVIVATFYPPSKTEIKEYWERQVMHVYYIIMIFPQYHVNVETVTDE